MQKYVKTDSKLLSFLKTTADFSFFLFIRHVNIYPIRKEACNG